MPFIFHEQPLIENEAGIALGNLYGGETIAHWLEELLENYGDAIDKEALLDNCAGLVELEQEIAAIIDPSDSRCALLYKKRRRLNRLSSAVFLHDLSARRGKRADLGTIIALSVMPDWWDDDLDEIVGKDAYLAWVEGIEGDAQDRFDLLRLYLDFDTYADCARESQAMAEAVIRRRLPDFALRLADFHKRIPREIERLLDRMGFALRDGDTYDLYPSLLMPGGMAAQINEKLALSDVFVGIGLMRTIELVEAARARQEIPDQFLKALADPTKLSILRKLGERRYYSSELAVALGLTGATISHHMAALLNGKLVTMEKVGNRIYYEINRPGIRDGLALVGRLLGATEAKAEGLEHHHLA